MPEPDLWKRLKEARIAQVVLVYLGASWAILQAIDVLQGTLGLPEWVGPVAVILLLIGLAIVSATAWVQSLPQTTEREERGEVPGDWQVAPRALVGDLVAGEVPHLTWARSLLGGVFALGLMFGLAVLTVVVQRPISSLAPSFGPSEAEAGVAPEGIAVLPFSVTGEGLEIWREGMVDVLSTNLDGMGGYRTIDSRTVMARWTEHVGDDGVPDLRTALEAAAGTGARYGLVGGVVGTSSGVRIHADIYDLSSGEKVAQSWMEGTDAEVLRVVGELSVDLTRRLLQATGADLIQAPRAASLTTHSLPALRAYLRGEAAYRKTDFPAAVAAFERAVEEDSTFALAWFRLGDSYGWLEDIRSERGAVATGRAVQLADRLPARDRVLVLASKGLGEGNLEALDLLLDAVRNYPDDPEAWYLLGDLYLHYGVGLGLATLEEAREAFDRAVALDPSFVPYQVHRVEAAILAGDTASAGEALAQYHRYAADQAAPYLQLMFDLFLTDPTRREEVLQSLDTVDLRTVALAGQWPKAGFPDQAWVEEVARRCYTLTGHTFWWWTLLDSHLARGQVAAAMEMTRDRANPLDLRYPAAVMLRAADLGPSGELDAFLGSSETCPGADAADPGLPCLLGRGMVAARRGDWSRFERVRAENREVAGAIVPDSSDAPHRRRHAALEMAFGALQAYHRDGDRPQAVTLLKSALEVSLGGVGDWVLRWTLADFLAPVRPWEALRILERFEGAGEGYASVKAGRIYEAIGDPDAARLSYQAAVERLSEGDAEDPYFQEAAEAFARLTSTRPGTSSGT